MALGAAPQKPPLPSRKGRRRGLRAILAADIAGFSAVMSVNETAAVTSLGEVRKVALRQLEAYGGWLFGMPGDGLFAIFESAIDAVRCALETQRELAEHPDLGGMRLRVGIHLGEVLFDDDLPYGEALNIAARLESLADPGGILISSTVLDAVSARVSATFEDRGVPRLKNIPRRIQTFAVTQPPERSPVDETQSGASGNNLDRTTHLDGEALRQIKELRRAAAAGGLGGDRMLPATQSSEPPNTPTPDEQQPGLDQDQAVPFPEVELLPPADPLAQLEQPQEAGLPETAPEEPFSTLPMAASDPEADAYAYLSDPAGAAMSLGDEPLSIAQPEAPSSDEDDLEDTRILSEQSEAAEPSRHDDQLQPLPGGLGDECLSMMADALAVHLGPVARILVNRYAGDLHRPEDLVARLVEQIPSEDERVVFRVRASQICKTRACREGL